MVRLKKKSQLNLEMSDYVVRAIVKKGASVEEWRAVELPLEPGVIEQMTIVDELALFGLLQNNLQVLGGKKQQAKLFAPDTAVLLKKIDYPQSVQPKDVKSYLNMEIGQSIHLPFQEPLIDVHEVDVEAREAILFAAASEEVNKMVGLLLDAHLEPTAVDIRALCNLRVLEQLQLIDTERTFLVADWSINGVSICIYSYGQVEFLRYQSIDTDLTKWEVTIPVDEELIFTYAEDEKDYEELINNQVVEIDRMMNFFKFSLHKGERAVDEVIVLGDNPVIDKIESILQNNLSVAIRRIINEDIQKQFPQFKVKHAALLGLALKEGTG